jgi:hypothetical protein
MIINVSTILVWYLIGGVMCGFEQHKHADDGHAEYEKELFAVEGAVDH